MKLSGDSVPTGPAHHLVERGVDDTLWLSFLTQMAKSYYDYTITDWRKVVNLDSYRVRPFVVVDPNDPSGLLYLSASEYLRLTTTSLSNQVQMTVVARPGQLQDILDAQSGRLDSASGE